jgi:GntR family transcriptional regulator
VDEEPKLLEKHAPLHERLLHVLKERIMNGEYQDGSEFPSERELAAEFDVSRATVRSAVTSLVGRGLLIRRRGIGTFVSPLAKIANPINEIKEFSKLIASGGFEANVKISDALVVEADESLSEALSVDTGSQLLRFNSVFSADGEPLIFAVTSIPVQIIDDYLEQILEDPGIIDPLFRFLEERCGVRVENMITTFWPDTVQSCPMDIDHDDTGTPVLMMDYVAYTKDGAAIYHAQQAYIGKRIKFNLIRHRGESV